MERNKIKIALSKIGYSKDSIKSILVGRMTPSAQKMFKLEDEFGIPVSAWRDIKSFLQENNTKKAHESATAKGA